MIISSILSAAMLVAADPNISTVVEVRPCGQEYLYTQKESKQQEAKQNQDEILFKEEVLWLKTRQTGTTEASNPTETNTQTHTQPQQVQSKSAVLYFGFDKSKLEKKEVEKLGNFDANDSVVIAGYASKEGTKQYNDKLSERRAKTIAHELQTHGIKIKKIEHFGEECKEKQNELCRKAEVKSGD